MAHEGPEKQKLDVIPAILKKFRLAVLRAAGALSVLRPQFLLVNQELANAKESILPPWLNNNTFSHKNDNEHLILFLLSLLSTPLYLEPRLTTLYLPWLTLI